MEGSHKYFKEFGDWHPYELQNKEGTTQEKTKDLEYVNITDDELEWFKSKGCIPIRQSVRKGGMILWDSRLVHQGAPPKRGRQNPGRWRFATFVCMGPAAWATEKDLNKKKRAYENIQNTAHWPCRDVIIMVSSDTGQAGDPCLPDVALTDEARKLAGILPYEFNDGQSNGPPLPLYRN